VNPLTLMRITYACSTADYVLTAHKVKLFCKQVQKTLTIRKVKRILFRLSRGSAE